MSALCQAHEAIFIVNDRPDVAALSAADGVHLGPNDLPVAAARRVLPPTAIVGVTAHTVDQVAAAVLAAPDYIAVGPMFPSPTKPQEPVAGPGTLAAARQHTGFPLVAIGGIDEHNARSVLEALPSAMCVCSAVVARPDVQAACLRLRAVIDDVLDPPASPLAKGGCRGVKGHPPRRTDKTL